MILTARHTYGKSGNAKQFWRSDPYFFRPEPRKTSGTSVLVVSRELHFPLQLPFKTFFASTVSKLH